MSATWVDAIGTWLSVTVSAHDHDDAIRKARRRASGFRVLDVAHATRQAGGTWHVDMRVQPR